MTTANLFAIARSSLNSFRHGHLSEGEYKRELWLVVRLLRANGGHAEADAIENAIHHGDHASREFGNWLASNDYFVPVSR